MHEDTDIHLVKIDFSELENSHCAQINKRTDAPDEKSQPHLLATFLAENNFPFHLKENYTDEEAIQSATSSLWNNESSQSYWVMSDAEIIGVLRFDDLEDFSVLFDLRLAQPFRGKGYGVPILKAATDYLFTTVPTARRFEGQAREDNYAMRKVFLKAGWVKEAMYRQGWDKYTSVAYAILRSDWENNTVTPVIWEEPAELLS